MEEIQMKRIVIATAVALSFVSVAHAQDNNERRATPAPIVAAPAPTAAGTELAIPAPTAPAPTVVVASVPEGCKLVKFTRPDVKPAKPEIYLNLRGYGASIEAIQACNPDALIRAGSSNVFGVVRDPTVGAKVSVRTVNGSGVIGLPTMYAIGDVHQLVCDIVDGAITFNLYRAKWDALPNEINLVRQTDVDNTAAMKVCEAMLPPDRRAQLRH